MAMQTYKVIGYPDFMNGDYSKAETVRAANIDNLRRNLIKTNNYVILTIATPNMAPLGDLSIGVRYGKKHASWRKHASGDRWSHVDLSTGKIGKYFGGAY